MLSYPRCHTMSRNIIISHISSRTTHVHIVWLHSTPVLTVPFHTPMPHSTVFYPVSSCTVQPLVTQACHPSPRASSHLFHGLVRTVQTSTILATNALRRGTLVLRQGLAVQPRLASDTCQFSCLSLLNFEKTGTTHHCQLTALHHSVICHHAHIHCSTHATPHTPHHKSHVTPFYTMHPTRYSITNTPPQPRTPHILHNTSHITLFNSSYPTPYIPTTYHMLHILQHTFHSTHLFYTFHTIHPTPYI